MNLRRKKPRPLTREEKPLRDARLFVVATEDTHAPDVYFRIFENPRIKVKVLFTEDGLSSPNHVLERLDLFEREFDLFEDDERWLMLDTDHWVQSNHVANYTHVCTEAAKKGFGLAHSNPCFEVWLLLHVTELAANDQFRDYGEVEERLRIALGGYNKCSLDVHRFTRETAAVAVKRAERMDESPGDRWPQKTGTHVYRLVKKLLGN